MLPSQSALLIGLTALVVGSAPVSAQAHPAEAAPKAAPPAMLHGDAAAAARTVDAFHAALKAGDEARALSLLAEDALIFEAGGAERSRAVYASHHLAADAKFEGGATTAIERRAGAAAGDLAWIATEARVEAKTADKVTSRLMTETMMLRRTPVGWRIVHIHWSSRAAPASH
jgi:ketosteroid isomerase-like protein